MSRATKVTGAALVPFAIAGILFGIIYNALFYPHTLIEYVEASTIGLILGLVTGILELSYLRHRFDKQPFVIGLIFRTSLYAVFVAVSLCLVLSIEPASLKECLYFRCVIQHFGDPLFIRDLFFSTVFVFFATFSAQVVMLIGTRNFRRLLVGQYRQPREIYAVFMFADIRSSTTIAEKLGHELFSAFLRDFFNDVADAIYHANGEIYQYVGDEVVIVWPGDTEKNRTSWLACYQGMVQDLKDKSHVYRKKYGLIPVFKAGVHSGLVVVTEVGTLQKAHVYHGDVLNTASRIQSKCNEFGFNLLVSEQLASKLSKTSTNDFQKVGAVHLRGKSETVVVYGFDKTS